MSLVNKLFKQDRTRLAPANVNDALDKKLGIQDRVALLITQAVGTMWAVYALSVFMAVWMVWQFFLSKQAFDPYPYAFLLFIGNIIQLLLMPLIMVGQNIQSRHSELRAEESYKTALANYKDSEHVMDHLAALDRELLLHRELLMKILKNQGEEHHVDATVIEGIYVSINGHLQEDDN